MPTSYEKIKTIFEMETSDPDDFLTLLRLLDHPEVKLLAVLLTPGYPDQVALVRWALNQFDSNIPIGAFNAPYKLERTFPSAVSSWHYEAYGDIKFSGWNVINGGEALSLFSNPEIVLLTGCPPKNLGRAMELKTLQLKEWFCQGGFAGEGVVPSEKQLEKFKGLKTCPSFNPNGAPRVVFKAIDNTYIKKKYFVSKNVCHGVLYDKAFHDNLEPLRTKRKSLDLMWKGMDVYLKKKPFKALHDPLAAMCMINKDIGEWKEVEIIREKGEWGAKLKPGSDTQIIIDYKPDLFFEEFTR